ncbi:MAG: STAS domain-containing protein [Pseudomonadota bacterium]
MPSLPVNSARLDPLGAGEYGVSGAMCFETVIGLLQQSGALFSGASSVVVDLGGVERADSAGVAVLVEWLRLARSKGVALRFRHIPAQMWSIVEASDLAARLPLQNAVE